MLLLLLTRLALSTCAVRAGARWASLEWAREKRGKWLGTGHLGLGSYFVMN